MDEESRRVQFVYSGLYNEDISEAGFECGSD